MASSDAKPIPQKNVAYRVTFPIYDNDGDLVTGAAALDTEVSKDGGTFADCTNEATEIATASGIYYLDLTSTEMNADTVAIIVKTTTTDAKTTPIVMYPEEAGDIRVNVTEWIGTAVTLSTNNKPDVNVNEWADVNLATTNPLPNAAPAAAGGLVISTLGTTDADDCLTATGFATSAKQDTMETTLNDVPTTVEFNARTLPSADYTIVTDLGTVQTGDTYALANGAAGFAAINTDVELILADTNELQTDDIPGKIVALDAVVDTVKDDTAAILLDTDVIDDATSGLVKIAADVAAILVDTGTNGVALLPATQTSIDNIEADTNELQVDDYVTLIAALQTDLDTLTDARGEPAQGAPGVSVTTNEKIDWLYKAWRNQSWQTATTYSLYNDAATVVDSKATVSDDGTTAKKGEVVTGP